MKLPPGSAFAVVGIGGLGGLGIQFAKAQGFRVAAIDNREEGRALAAEVPVKPDLILDPHEKDAEDKLKEWADKLGPAGIMICTDYIEATTWALKQLRPRGIAVELGLPTKPFEFEPFKLVFDETQIRGSVVANKEQTAEMMRAVAKHKIRTKITPIKLEEALKLPESYMDPHLKGRLVLKFD